MPERTLYATMIGINDYPQNALNGCIEDVLSVDLILRKWCQQQEKELSYNPRFFLAPNNSDKNRIADYQKDEELTLDYDAPTFENLSRLAFEHLKAAKDGDICLLYYSGHGSQTDAPQEFWHTKPDRQNETLVCVDSRDPTNPAARDLIDKELAYLIWDTLEGKEVHCLVIMDCCHSGNNLRAMQDSDIQFRFTRSAGSKIPLEKYLGYDKNFYELKDGKASVKVARYVHLAAARDTEKAQETRRGGLFTNKLLEQLRAGGTAKAYRELVRSLSISVRNRAEQQNPVAYAKIEDDLDLRFLGTALLPYKPAFEVSYDHKNKKWLMYGGAMEGLVSTGPQAATIVRIAGYDKDIDVVEVFSSFSVLDEEDTEGLDKNNETYTATLKQLASPAIEIGLSPALREDKQLMEALREAYESEPHLFFEIDFDMGFTAPDFIIQVSTDDEYVLTRNNSDVPLFKHEEKADSFLRNVDSVGKWISASELKQTDTAFKAEDFVFTLEKIEGEALSYANLDEVTGEESTVTPEEEIILSYKDDKQPAFRFSINVSPNSKLQSCYTGGLYLESKYGIRSEIIEDSGRIVKDGSPINLSIQLNNKLYKTLPVAVDSKYKLYRINEITAFLKIFVSNRPLDLHRFRQPNLELEDKPNLVLRDIGLAREEDNLGDETDWTVFKFPIRIIGPNKSHLLEENAPADFNAFTVHVPPGFAANAFSVTGDDQQRKLRHATTRAVAGDDDSITDMVTPPANIWGDVLTDPTPFPKGLSAVSDNGIQAIELMPANGNKIMLPEGEEIIIKPKQQERTTRSEDSLEDTVIPFGFDDESQLYFPLGYSDEDGNIHITQLPQETPGRIQSDEPLTRSLGGSVKLFFKKIFRKKDLNKLVLYEAAADGKWQMASDDPESMKGIIGEKTGAKVLLLTHGLTGDTKHMLACLQEMPELNQFADYLITFDYENLATPMAKTAQNLDELLRGAGFGEQGMPGITFIAHSQGGLVARWLVEKEKANDYINHLILVGAASGGSELANLGSSVFGMLTHALNVTGPIKYVITGLSFLLKKLELNPAKTLKETNPGSDFLVKLNGGSLPQGVKYSVIGGDTLLLKDYEGDDFFLKKIAHALAKNIVYPGLTQALYKDKPNDMAVTIESMKAIPGLNEEKQMQVVASNHLAYFRENLCRAALIKAIEGFEK